MRHKSLRMRRSKSSGVGTRASLRVEAYVISVQSANRRRITLGYVFTCMLIKLEHAMLNIKNDGAERKKK